MKILLVIISITFSTTILLANNYKLMDSTYRDLNYGWSQVKEVWGIPDSGYVRSKLLILNPNGDIVKELYEEDDTEHPLESSNRIDYVVNEDNLLISTYTTNPRKTFRFWKFEILNTNGEIIYYEEFMYETIYFSFGFTQALKTITSLHYPYFIAADDMYIYYLNSDFTAVEQVEVNFKDIDNLDHLMPTPRRINFNDSFIDVKYEFPSAESSSSDIKYIFKINITN